VSRHDALVATVGTVRSWDDEQGCGVVDSDQTPGGCWVHFSQVAMVGYRRLLPGQQVLLDWESADQDGFAFRALAARPLGAEPAPGEPEQRNQGAYRSILTLTFDDPPSAGERPAD
jgi:CspA family cold shock protein